MELINRLKRSLVGIDTPIFIYFIEENPKYYALLNKLFKKIEKGEIQSVTSIVTLLELLVRPFKKHREDIIKDYKLIFQQSLNIDLINLNPEIAEISAKLRAEHDLRTPDAIQVGTALFQGANFFLTNDKHLKKLNEIPVLILEDFLTI